MNKVAVIDGWLLDLRCPTCGETALDYPHPGRLTCRHCQAVWPASRNYADLLASDERHQELAARYTDVFTRLSRGKLGSAECYYSKTADEELEEFLAEVRLSRDQLQGLKVLDAGCGIARLTRNLSSLGAVCVALDIHSRLSQYAQQDGMGAQDLNSPVYIRASVDSIPFDSCFDVVWCQGVLSYLPDPFRAIRELQRVARRGGLVYMDILSSDAVNILFRIARALRGLPSALREPLYDLMAWVFDHAVQLRNWYRGVPDGRKSQTRLHLRDWSTPTTIQTISLQEVVGLFEEMAWTMIWAGGGRTIRCLARKR